MAYVIGTDGDYSTWASLRGVFYNPGTNDVVGFAEGYFEIPHNRYYPIGSFDIYPPAAFIDASGSMFRKVHYYPAVGVQYPQYYEPMSPSYWDGNMLWYGFDHKDFEEMVGATLDFSPGVVQLAQEAEYFTGGSQFITNWYDFGFGIKTIQKFKVLT